MANDDSLMGARIYGEDLGSHPYPHSVDDAVIVYPGDFVKTTGGYCTVAAATQRLRGVAQNYVGANSAVDVMVWDNPLQEFVIQDDAGATLSQAEVGENCDILATAGNATLQISQMELAATGHATTTAQLRIIRPAKCRNMDGSLNAVGNHCKWIVTINEHEGGPAENVGT